MKKSRRPRNIPEPIPMFSWRAFWVCVCQGLLAWLMAAWNQVYAPIPMFAAAVLAGVLFQNRPQQAARQSLLAGFLAGPLAEWAYFSVRLQSTSGNWAAMSMGEVFGLAVAEMSLYAGLLSFFAAFISWGTADHKNAQPVSARTEGRAGGALREEIPFSPEEEEEAHTLPLFTQDTDASDPDLPGKQNPSKPKS